MKKLLLSISLALSIFSTNAQLKDGATAPDWTLTDIDGNSHTLYDILDAGKTVILDFSATWCGPCWAFHTSGALEDVYHDLGPDGTDEVMVFFMEGDSKTNLNNLHGVNGNAYSSSSYRYKTLGNWVAGTDYPIIEAEAVTQNYAITAWPTVYMINPRKQITNIALGSTGDDIKKVIAGSLPLASGQVNPALIGYSNDINTCSETELIITIENQGTDGLTACTIEASDNGTVLQTINWTGNLDTYETEEVSFGNLTITEDKTIDFTITSMNDEVVDKWNTLEQVVEHTASSGYISSYRLQVVVGTDDYPGDNSWEIRDENNTVVASHTYSPGPSGTGVGGEDASTLHKHDIVLPSGNHCYTFELFDSRGDGMEYGPRGDFGYALVDFGGYAGTQSWTAKQNTQWSSLRSRFRTDAAISSIVENEILSNVNVYPNPFNGSTNIELDLAKVSDVNFTVSDLTGKTIKSISKGQLTAGSHTISLELDNVKGGIYFLNIQTGDHVITKMITTLD